MSQRSSKSASDAPPRNDVGSADSASCSMFPPVAACSEICYGGWHCLGGPPPWQCPAWLFPEQILTCLRGREHGTRRAASGRRSRSLVGEADAPKFCPFLRRTG